MRRLVLIDGNAILHRAFYALPETLTLKNGSPVNAVYGFTSMLLGVVEKLKPNYLICAFDLPKPTFRDKLYEDYRAQRPKTPEKLIAQIEMVKNVVRVLNIPIYEVEGYEADDVIGTLAKQATKASSGTNFFSATNSASSLRDDRPIDVENSNISAVDTASSGQTSSSSRVGVKQPPPAKKLSPSEASCASHQTSDITHHTSRLEIIIVTGDRDLLQLIDKQIKVYIPIKGLSETRMYGEREVEEKYGINPEQMVDYKALVGDPSDNYPGVKGIGPKTAAELIKRFGTLENIYTSIVKNNTRSLYKFYNLRIKKALQQHRKDALMAKKLAKIVTDIPVELDLEAAKVSRFDTLDVKELFDKLSFKTLWRRVKESQNSRPEEDQPQAEKADQLTML